MYPKEIRGEVKEIYLNEPDLEGELNLGDFTHEYSDYRGKKCGVKISISPDLDESKLVFQNKPASAEIFKCVSSQEWLDQNYPREGTCLRETAYSNNFGKTRSEITYLDIDNHYLSDSLDLAEFINLRELSCSENQITSLDLKDCGKLEYLYCHTNQLTNLILPTDNNLKILNCSNNLLPNLNWSVLSEEKLTSLNLENNNFPEQDLSYLVRFTNLETLRLGTDNQTKIHHNIYNRWTGSLEYLQGMSKLARLGISNTDLNSGVEYLPESLAGVSEYGSKKITYSIQERPNSKVKEIIKPLDLFTSREYKNWINLNFAGLEIKSWLGIGLKIDDCEIANYFRNSKNLTPEEARQENLTWKTIHPDFTLPLQKEWGERGFIKEEIKSWLEAGLESNDYEIAKKWKELECNAQQTKEWMEAGLKINEYEIAKNWKKIGCDTQQTKQWINIGLTTYEYQLAEYLKYKNYKPTSDLNLSELRREYERNKINIQLWLDQNYPQETRPETKQINIKGYILEGSLNLSDFPNLEILNCSNNNLTNLDVSKCLRLKELDISYNTNISLKLEHLPNNLEKFICESTKIQEEMDKQKWFWENKVDEITLLQRWKQANKNLITKLQLEKLQDQLKLLEAEKEKLAKRIAFLEEQVERLQLEANIEIPPKK